MNKEEAEMIINQYGAAIVADQNIFRKKSSLPCSKAKIRYAYYVYIPALVEHFGGLPNDIRQSISASYSLIGSFLDDNDADFLNETGRLIKEKALDEKVPEDKKRMDNFFDRAPLATSSSNVEYFYEIDNYIVECLL